jgi:transcriptional regulator with XRE-family HTH domain
MSSALMKSIGRAARQARRARKLTQEDVADRVGVSTQFYGRIERGNALPSVTTLRRMLEVLDLRADELLGTLELYDADESPDGDVGDVGADSDDSSEGAGPQRSSGVENPRLRRLMRYLRRASPVTLETVEVLLDQIDKAGAVRRGQGAGAPDEKGEPDDDGDDGGLDDADDADDDEPAAGGNA